MNQKQLEIFITLADNLNFTRTAEQLYLSQTTVTLQIRSLEEELHAKLFERTRRSVKLTYAGGIFLDKARDILERIKDAVQETAFASQGYTGHLHIGFADDVNASGISSILRRFSLAHPEIMLRVQGGYPGDLLNGLTSDEFDLIFTPSFRKIQNEKLSRCVLKTYRTVAAFHQDHPFHKKKSLKFSDFEGEKYIFISGDREELDFSNEFKHQLDLHHVHVHQIARIDNIDTVFLMLDSNLGVTVLPEYFSGRFAGTSQISICPIEENLKPTDFLAVWKSRRISEELELFSKFITDDTEGRDTEGRSFCVVPLMPNPLV